MTGAGEIADLAGVLAGEAHGSDNAAAVAFLLGVDRQDVHQLMIEAQVVAEDRCEDGSWLGEFVQTVLVGVELGVAAEWLRGRS